MKKYLSLIPFVALIALIATCVSAFGTDALDGATVTSVLVPWNTCGLVQSTVLGVATLAYLPYCFFNFLSPLTSIMVAASGRIQPVEKQK